MIQEMNFGLVRRVCDAFRRFSVMRLGKTYSSLSVADVVRRTFLNIDDLKDVAGYLGHLISTGALNATLTQRGPSHGTWILGFEEGLGDKTEAQQLRELKDTEARLLDLSARITESDQKFGISKEYLEWRRKAEAKSKDETPGVAELMEDFTQDEDMMVDM